MHGLAAFRPAVSSLAGSAQWLEAVRTLKAVIVGSLLLALSAKVQVPFWPVPMTMQTFAVLGLGFALGPIAGTGAVLLYLAEGLAGLPVFAVAPERGIGLAYVAGPTGGYLLGFLLAAPLTGLIGRRGPARHVTALAAALLGTATIFLCGFAWLAVLMGPALAFKEGVLPFLPGATVTAALVTVLVPACRKRSRT